MTTKSKKYKIVITNGRKTTYNFRDVLYDNDFRYSKTDSAWILTIYCNSEQKKYYKKLSKKCGLSISFIDTNTIRSNDYRLNFFNYYDGIFHKKIYACAYCGHIHKKDNITIDHIVPVHKAQNSMLCRFYLRHVVGTSNVNDVHNLAPACSKCNSSKGSKTGLWIVRGSTGKFFSSYITRKIIEAIVLFILVLDIAAYLCKFLSW